MRKRLLGSVAALAAGAGSAWGQPPVEPAEAPPAVLPAGLPDGLAPAPPGGLAPAPPLGGPPQYGGIPSRALPGMAGFAPAPTIMPPGNYGPPHDPLGLGPVGGFGPPPGPMYPMPGPYDMQSFQPAPRMPNVPGMGGGADGSGGAGGAGRLRDVGYGCAPHWWVRGEYLIWFTNGQKVRFPLLTTSAPSDAGMLGAASTTVLVGQRDLGYNSIDGMRFTGGFFGDADRRFGFEMTGFLLERVANIQRFGDTQFNAGIPTFARPFLDVNGVQSTVVLSGPDFGAAQVEVGTNHQTWGLEPVGIWNVFRSEPGGRAAWSLDFIAGYKFVQMKEDLWVHSRTLLDNQVALPIFVTGPFGIITQLPPIIIPSQTTFGGVTVGGPAVVELRDQFRATNKFNGGVLGWRAEARYGMWTTDTYAKVGIGNMHQRVDIFGGGAFFDPTGRSGTTAGVIGAFPLGVGGGAGAAVGGVLANASNIGSFSRDEFTVIPEFGGNVGVALTRGITGYVGVSAMFLPDVVRPGDQVNPVVSSAAIPFSGNYGAFGAPRAPRMAIRDTHLWLGGVNFGLQIRY